jgi:uncharacterized protein (DUF362 family)/NAD-dependent dihydropyrimidine dehydrogenase PreA subunit
MSIPFTPPPSSAARSVVAAVRCPDYSAPAVERAVRAALAALGGISAHVRPGQTVLLKPNLLSARLPEQAVTTHPALMTALVRLCQEAGAARVWIGDSPAGQHAEAVLWEQTGMAAVAAATGAELKSFHGPLRTRSCAGLDLPSPAWLDEVDVLITVPKLKTHILTILTGAVKNQYGLVAGQAKANFHSHFPAPVAMSQFLAQLFGVFRPHLAVMDAVVAMEGEGPANGRPKFVGLILAGTDAVAVDAAAARVLNLAPARIPLLREAALRGFGNLNDLELVGDGTAVLDAARLKPSLARFLQGIPEPLFRLVTRLVRWRPRIDRRLCNGCGICARTCPRSAIYWQPGGGPPAGIDAARCILCMCCAESCPRHAIAMNRSLNPWRT